MRHREPAGTTAPVRQLGGERGAAGQPQTESRKCRTQGSEAFTYFHHFAGIDALHYAWEQTGIGRCVGHSETKKVLRENIFQRTGMQPIEDIGNLFMDSSYTVAPRTVMPWQGEPPPAPSLAAYYADITAL